MPPFTAPVFPVAELPRMRLSRRRHDIRHLWQSLQRIVQIDHACAEDIIARRLMDSEPTGATPAMLVPVVMTTTSLSCFPCSSWEPSLAALGGPARAACGASCAQAVCDSAAEIASDISQPARAHCAPPSCRPKAAVDYLLASESHQFSR
jgi:hypothetical protein